MRPKQVELKYIKNPIRHLDDKQFKHFLYRFKKAISEDLFTITYKHTK
jgi:hypothetical protein